ncbi:hypothetical protein Pst134EB_025257 [Puccinia striiformis f. sp. tritici]|nr:hypothetical protein Pst134EB_025257 [Puccinia striiformis f. sp. tritici]
MDPPPCQDQELNHTPIPPPPTQFPIPITSHDTSDDGDEDDHPLINEHSQQQQTHHTHLATQNLCSPTTAHNPEPARNSESASRSAKTGNPPSNSLLSNSLQAQDHYQADSSSHNNDHHSPSCPHSQPNSLLLHQHPLLNVTNTTTDTISNTPRLPYQESESDSSPSSPELLQAEQAFTQSPPPLSHTTDLGQAALSQTLEISTTRRTTAINPSDSTLGGSSTALTLPDFHPPPSLPPLDHRPSTLSSPDQHSARAHQPTPPAQTNPLEPLSSSSAGVCTLTSSASCIHLRSSASPHPSISQSLGDQPHCSRTPSPCTPRVQLPSRDQSAHKQQRKGAPLSSSTRTRSFICRSSLSTATSEVEHGFTTDEDIERTSVFTGFLHSLIGAPMPSVHELLNHHPQPHTSERSSPSRFDHSPTQNIHDDPPPPIATPDQHSSSSRLSRPISRLSDENLQRQCTTGLKERVKKSVKMRETERWARETSTNSQQTASPNLHPQSHTFSPVINPAQIPAYSSDFDDRNISALVSLSPIQYTTNVHSSPSPETLPRPRISVQPVPSFKAVPTTAPSGECTMISEHASVNDWQSENTNPLAAGPSQHQYRTLLHLSPIDVQFIGQTPTSVEFPSLMNNGLPPTILPGTVIGGMDLPKDLHNAHILPLPLSPLPPPPSDHESFSQSPRIQEIPLTPPARTPQQISDPLMRARISLQDALSATPQARSTSNSPATSPARQYHSQNTAQAYPPNFGEGHSSDDGDNDSGLSPIKEDRTAEMAAEHSWRIRQATSPFNPSHRALNHNHLQLALSRKDVDHADPYTQFAGSSHPHASKSDHSTASGDPDQTQNSINFPTSHSSTGLVDDGGSMNKHTRPSTAQQTLNGEHERGGANESLGCSQSNNDERASLRTISNSALSSDDVVLPSSQPPTSSQPQGGNADPNTVSSHSSAPTALSTTQLNPRPSAETITCRRQVSPLSVRTGTVAKPNPPLSLPASARRPLPVDLLNRLEMEEWRNQTGIDDRHSLSLRSVSSPLAGGSLTMSSGPDIDRGGLVGVGGEERRGIKDRWGNSWGLESHVLSPLSERTERSLTTVGSLMSLSTKKSTHSLRSLDSTSNSLVQRLEQADTSSVRMMKLGSSLIPTGVIRTGPSNSTSNQMSRSVSCPLNRIDSPTKSSPLGKSEFHNSKDPPHLLLEEKMKRKEERRLKREKRDKRRAEEIKSSESLAQKQERRRQEKKRKEEFLEKKHQILLRLQEDGENPQLVRDLGILYLTSNVGIAGLKLAIRHLETSLQMNDTDALAWSSLGKAWSQLHGVPEAELARLPDARETNKSQQAHNATIGLRKAIINSRTHADALKYKVEWARYLEKLGRWRDSLGVIGEVIKNEGKLQPKCWAALGFVGLRLVFGWAPLENLEADDLEQGFIEGASPQKAIEGNTLTDGESLSDPDRVKLLSQVHHAFERALALIDEQIHSATLQVNHSATTKGKIPATVTTTTTANKSPIGGNDHQEIHQLKSYKKHYEFQLAKVDAIEKKMTGEQNGLDATESHTASVDPAANSQPGADQPTDIHPLGLDAADSRNTNGSVKSESHKQSDDHLQSDSVMDATTAAPTVDSDLVTEEIRECPSPSLHSSPAQSCLPVCQDPEPTNYVGVNATSSSQSSRTRDILNEQQRDVLASPASPSNRYREITGAEYLDMATPTSQIDRSKSLPLENFDMRTPSSQVDFQRGLMFGVPPSMVQSSGNQPPSTNHSHNCSGSSDGPELIVQYDDVDTTNDYSDSRNSDPFRPSSSLGHHLARNVNQNAGPKSAGSPDNRVYSVHSDSHDHQSSLLSPPCVPNRSLPPSSADETNGHLSDEVKGTRGPGSPDIAQTQSNTVPNNYLNHSTSQQERPLPTTANTPIQAEHSHSDSRPSSASTNHRNTNLTSSLLLGGSGERELSPHQSTGSQEYNRHCPTSPNRLDPRVGRKTPGSSAASQHRLTDSGDVTSGHHHLDDPNMDLDSVLQSKLKELDKEKVIAFLELDSDYQSQVLKLRKKLLKIEEEREHKRNEMFSMLGLIKNGMECQRGSDQRGAPELDPDDDEEEEEDEEEEAEMAESIREEMPAIDGSRSFPLNREEVGQGRAGAQASLGRHRHQASRCSAHSASSLPVHNQQQHRRSHHGCPPMAGHSRSVCSPPLAHNRTFSLDAAGIESPIPRKTPGASSSTSTAVGHGDQHSLSYLQNLHRGDHSSLLSNRNGNGDEGQANIALQGIAAILKLATTVNTHNNTSTNSN